MSQDAQWRHSKQRMTCVKMSVDELVTNVAPADLALQRHVEPFVREVAAFVSNQQRGGIGERDESDAYRSRRAA